MKSVFPLRGQAARSGVVARRALVSSVRTSRSMTTMSEARQARTPRGSSTAVATRTTSATEEARGDTRRVAAARERRRRSAASPAGRSARRFRGSVDRRSKSVSTRSAAFARVRVRGRRCRATARARTRVRHLHRAPDRSLPRQVLAAFLRCALTFGRVLAVRQSSGGEILVFQEGVTNF